MLERFVDAAIERAYQLSLSFLDKTLLLFSLSLSLSRLVAVSRNCTLQRAMGTPILVLSAFIGPLLRTAVSSAHGKTTCLMGVVHPAFSSPHVGSVALVQRVLDPASFSHNERLASYSCGEWVLALLDPGYISPPLLQDPAPIVGRVWLAIHRSPRTFGGGSCMVSSMSANLERWGNALPGLVCSTSLLPSKSVQFLRGGERLWKHPLSFFCRSSCFQRPACYFFVLLKHPHTLSIFGVKIPQCVRHKPVGHSCIFG